MPPKRISYTTREKLAIIKYAEAHGNRAAGREHNVPESNIRQWRKMKERLVKSSRSQRANRGKTAQYPQIETPILKFIEDRRAAGLPVSTTEIRLKALAIAKTVEGGNGFKASVNWCYRFMARHNYSIRRRTHISQQLPADFDDKLIKFQQFIISQRKKNEYDLGLIGNADQTPLTFDLPSEMTVAKTGSKSVNMITTGNEKNRFTVMLACTADGQKLMPYVIFKRKTMPKDIFPPGIIVRVQEKGWMNDSLMKDWVKCVWGKRNGGLRRKRSLLVLDAFRCHRSEFMKDILTSEHNTDLAIIPGGMTCMLQPLDVGINKPMKNALRLKWNSWMESGEHSYTAGGKRRKVELPTICLWIVECWNELDPNIIVRSFKKCCISNAMDGTEDDILWDENKQKKDSVDDSGQGHSDDSDSDDSDDDADIVYSDVTFGPDDMFNIDDYNKMFGDSDNDSDHGDENEFYGFGPSDINRE